MKNATQGRQTECQWQHPMHIKQHCPQARPSFLPKLKRLGEKNGVFCKKVYNSKILVKLEFKLCKMEKLSDVLLDVFLYCVCLLYPAWRTLLALLNCKPSCTGITHKIETIEDIESIRTERQSFGDRPVLLVDFSLFELLASSKKHDESEKTNSSSALLLNWICYWIVYAALDVFLRVLSVGTYTPLGAFRMLRCFLLANCVLREDGKPALLIIQTILLPALLDNLDTLQKIDGWIRTVADKATVLVCALLIDACMWIRKILRWTHGQPQIQPTPANQ